MIEAQALRSAWAEFIADAGATHAVTLAYNNRINGSSEACYRTTFGKRVRIRSASTQPTPALPSVRYIPLTTVHADLYQLHRDVDRRLFGSRFNLANSPRSFFRGFVEHADTNVHVHIAWQVPQHRCDGFEAVLRDCWLKARPYVSIHVRYGIDDGWARYVTKASQVLLGDPALFVADCLDRK